MIRALNESNGKMTLDDLAKKVAEYFNEAIVDAEVEDFQELKDLYWWTSKDVKEEVMACVNDYGKEGGFEAFDDGDIRNPDGTDVSYRKFRNMVFKYVKKNPNFDEDDDEEELTESYRKRGGDFSKEEIKMLRNLGIFELRDYYNDESNNLDYDFFPNFIVFNKWVRDYQF